MRGSARRCRQGAVGLGAGRHGAAGRGPAGDAGQVDARLCEVRSVWAGKQRQGAAGSGCQGRAGKVLSGPVRVAWYGRLVLLSPGALLQRVARCCGAALVRQCSVRRSMRALSRMVWQARCYEVRPGSLRRRRGSAGGAGHGRARHGVAGAGTVWQAGFGEPGFGRRGVAWQAEVARSGWHGVSGPVVAGRVRWC